MKLKKLASLALAGALTLGLLPALSSPALAADGDTSTYTLTIPSALTVANSGWNATDGISATGTLASGKKLTVTAASANSWALNSGDNSVGYNLATATGTYSSSATPASWEFTELTNTATNKPMGIIVEDYSTKPAGSYTDTVTFTASVGNAATTLDTNTTTWTADTYAVPAGGLTYNDAITVSGDVTLVLTDGETLTLNKGISVADGVTLTVQGNGTMNVNGSNGNTSSTVAGTGTLVLTSGTLTVNGGNGGDGGLNGVNTASGGVAINGNITVEGGTLTATGGSGGNIDQCLNVTTGNGAAAISGSVTVTGGTLTATGGNGGNIRESESVTTGSGAAAIGGNLTIHAGTVTTTNGSNGRYIGYEEVGTLGTGANAVAGTTTDNRN